MNGSNQMSENRNQKLGMIKADLRGQKLEAETEKTRGRSYKATIVLFLQSNIIIQLFVLIIASVVQSVSYYL